MFDSGGRRVSTWSIRPTTGCRARSTSLWVHKATSSVNCREMETCMFRTCYMPWQPLQTYSSGHLGGWVTLWSAEEMLDVQHQSVDIPANARTAHKGLLQKSPEEDLCWIVLHVLSTTQSVKGLDWTEKSEIRDLNAPFSDLLYFQFGILSFLNDNY